MHVELCKLVSPNWTGWEVSLVAGGRHTASTIFEHTSMYNFWPRTLAEQIEKEATDCADSMARKLGLSVVRTLIDSTTDRDKDAPR